MASTSKNMFRSISKLNLKREASVAAFTAALKAANLDDRHRWMFEKVAEAFGVDVSKVEDYILKRAHLSMINNFFKPNGPRKLLWYNQPLPATAEGEGGNKRTGPPRLFLTSGDDIGLRGKCVYFLRLSDTRDITPENVKAEIVVGTVQGDRLLQSLQDTLQCVMLPALSVRPTWGDVRTDDEKVRIFLDGLDRFVGMLGEVMASLAGGVELKQERLNVENKPAAFVQAAADPDIVLQCESLVDDWCRQIDMVVTESEVVRKEADDIGPNAELEHWKSRMAKFNSITDQLKSPLVRIVVGTLQAAKSRKLDAWKALDNKVTDAANEAKDNVKYLYTLERFSEPLYKSDPVQMVEAIPGLMNAIQMMHSIARYYNTSERMTALFVKITNQMITCCKTYINRDGDIWEQDRRRLIEKFNACINLNTAYQEAFHKTKARLQTQHKAIQFDFSEMYIFGKFEQFCKRITKLIDVFTIIEQFSTLRESSIEGMEVILESFNKVLLEMRNKHYDLLEYKRLEFETDYVEFLEKIKDLEKFLQEFINASFEPITSTERALALVKQFKNVLLREHLRHELENKYLVIFASYGRELDVMRKLYEKSAKSPPISRDTPEFAGSIAWARQLYRRIEQPMKVFQTHPHILYTTEAKKYIKIYNKLAAVLVETEMQIHQQWIDSVQEVKNGLQATVLVRGPDKKDRDSLFVNFDPLIVQVIRETKAMQRMELDVPATAKLICLQEDKFKGHYNQLTFMLAEYKRVVDKIKLSKLMGPHVEAVRAKIEPGLNTITWMSLSIETYLESVHDALAELEDLIDKANDIIECRVEAALSQIAGSFFITLSSSETWNIEAFVAKAEKDCARMAAVLDSKGLLIETAIKDLITLITSGYSAEDMTKVEQSIDRVYKEYTVQTFEAIVKSCKNSMELIKRRMVGVQQQGSQSLIASLAAPEAPLFKVDVELLIPTVVVNPRMEAIQQAMQRVATAIQTSTKGIYLWQQDRSLPADALKNYYLDISNHKDIVKLNRELPAGIAQLKTKVTQYLAAFNKYEFLWKANQQETYDAFLERKPTIEDFEVELQKYDSLVKEIDEIPGITEISALELNAQSLKDTLRREANAWKQFFGDNLKTKSHRDMSAKMVLFEEATIKLNRQVNDLDEIREVMKVLSELRGEEAAIDMEITPIEETYALLNRYEIRYSKEEADSADNLRYQWKKVKQLAQSTQDQLIKLQPTFRKELMQSLAEFDKDVADFVKDYTNNGPNVANIKPRVAVERLKTFTAMFNERQRKLDSYNGGERLFGMPVTEYPDIVRIRREIGYLNSLYTLYTDVIITVNGYEDVLWSDLKLENIQIQVKEFMDRCKKLPRQMREWEAFKELKKTIDDFDALMPVLEAMSTKAIQPRHWQQIMELTKHTFKLDPDTFKLKHVLEAPLLAKQDDILDICYAAKGEAEVETKLAAIEDEWKYASFEFSVFPGRGEIILNGEATQKIMSALEEAGMTLQSLLANRFNKPFFEQVQLWSQKLSFCSREIENWLKVQSLWIYLEAVFIGGDISKALPLESKRFASIDKSWVKIMSSAHDNPNVVSFVFSDETLRNLLPHLMEMLELCKNSLAGYLESKQQIFPRFYFLSNAALLEVLGQANSNTHTINSNLSKLFANMTTVRFHPTEYNTIIGMESAEGEYIPFVRPMECDGNVENWLNKLVDSMQKTVKSALQKGAMAMGAMEFKDFVMQNYAQVALMGIQLLWTEQCESALNDASKGNNVLLKVRNKTNKDYLNQLVELTHRNDISDMERVKIETLITIHQHQFKAFKKLYDGGVRSADHFEWQKQARFYWRPAQNDLFVSITDLQFRYCYEYLGCTDRLVITELTDRCYVTLAQSLGLCLGGAPAGPAGTGKTETVKDMGRALGKLVIIFNCSPEYTVKQMEAKFKGIAMSGCWGDFDEFNRIKLPVLSVAAQQIGSVFQAKREHKKKFQYTDGTMIPLDEECGIFITMNPTYAGRQALPENLKLLFRTVAMMVPDRKIIMEVKLLAAGFRDTESLAVKFNALYKMCEEQLSKQRHYDFGLRNILSVLRTCGRVKRVSVGEEDSVILQRVCRDMNLSKLVDDDYQLFLSLLKDLFVKEITDAHAYVELNDAIDNYCKKNGLTNHAPWKLKIIQLYETAQVRHGLNILGPSGAGKTACINTLMGALNETGQSMKEYRMNPKAVADQYFLGSDPGTNEWRDGIFTALWRKCNDQLKTRKGTKEEKIWLIMDGPIDSLWIESLNTVLDDTKQLSLPNGDRLDLHPNLKLVFEVNSVMNASPATVSRAGVIFMSDKALGWEPVYRAWTNNRNKPKQAEVLDVLFHRAWERVHTFVKEQCEEKMAVPDINHITTCCDLLTGMVTDESSPAAIGRLFVFALIWSLGGLLDDVYRVKFEKELTDMRSILDLPPVTAGSGDTVYDFVVSKDGAWEHWEKRVPKYVYPKTGPPPVFQSILVPTVSSVRTEYLISTLAKQQKSVLLIGEPGTAKTVQILQYLQKLNPETHLSKVLNFSSATTPALFQRIIELSVVKAHTVFTPPGQKKMVVFLDDISMPKINKHGDQETNEILRQLMEMKGFYSLEKPGEFSKIVDLQFLGAMFHPGSGRNDIPSRLKRQFAVFNCTLPSNANIDTIFSTIVTGFFCQERGFTSDVTNMAKRVIPLTRKLWSLTKAKMLPTPANFHYLFNLRDLSRITEGLVDVQSDVITSPKLLLQLWKHECDRVMCDKLVNGTDKGWFASTFNTILTEEFGPSTATDVQDGTYFVDFLRDEPDMDDIDPEDTEASMEAPKIYEPIRSMTQLRTRLEGFLTAFNSVRGQHLDLVLFEDCMKHIIKVSRIIRRPRGNALLVGVGGSGKQSVTRLAASIAGHKLVQLTMTRSYSINNFTDDLQNLYKITGGEGKAVTFIFTDNDIKNDTFLEYINSVLTAGDLTSVMAKDELENIYMELRIIMRKTRPDLEDTTDNVQKFFVERVRNNLHIVLCFSPVGEKFRLRALKFPGLFSGCTINWFEPWPKEALVAVAEKYFGNFRELVCTPQTKASMIQFMCNAHFIVEKTTSEYFERFRRHVYVTPKSYLTFINSYIAVYRSKKEEVDLDAQRMAVGLEKLQSAGATVVQLQADARAKAEKLKKAEELAAKVLAEIQFSTAEAQKEADKVMKVKEEVSAKAAQARQTALEADEELAKALPYLEAAAAALNTIDKKDINQLQQGVNPVHFTQRVLECVRILRYLWLEPVRLDEVVPQHIKTSWKESTVMMRKAGFLKELENFPKEQLNGEIIELLEPYFADSEFTAARAETINQALTGLWRWVDSMIKYFHVAADIEPKTIAKQRAERRLRLAEEDLARAQRILDEKMSALKEQQDKYNEALANKQRLLEDLQKTERITLTAQQLIEGLSGERERWSKKQKSMDDIVSKLVGDVAVATAFLSYAGPFNQDFRIALMHNWTKDLNTMKIPYNRDVTPIKLLVDDTTIGRWNIESLPTDGQSVENGIIVNNSSRLDAKFPLLIDPQGQGHGWILQREKANNLKRVTFETRMFRDILEQCITAGTPLLIEHVGDELDPILDSVLEKGVRQSNSKKFLVKVGDKIVDYHPDFRLYITTKQSNPRWQPEVYAKASVIDFTVTVRGLEDQLLGGVIRAEKEELERQRGELLEQVNSNKRKIKELEESLLERLANTEGALTEDQNLINVLRNTKRTSEEANEKLTFAQENEVTLLKAREEYRPVAARGSILYFLIAELSNVNAMYQTSLQQFLEVFDAAIENAPASHMTPQRIANIIEELTYAVYLYVARGLYENDKFLFRLQMALKIDLKANRVDAEEYRVFIKGGASTELSTVKANPTSGQDAISEIAWLNLAALSRLPAFGDILNQIENNLANWKNFFKLDKPEEGKIPDGYQERLSSFQRLLLIRCCCEDRMYFAAKTYIEESLGKKYTQPMPSPFDSAYAESRPRVPTVCLLSLGADPTENIRYLAKRNKMLPPQECSMGQGQEVMARRQLAQCMATGQWMLLQNCHLGLEVVKETGISFMEEVAVTLKTVKDIHDDFRLFITTEPTGNNVVLEPGQEAPPKFPITLLHMSLKMTNEAPVGMMAGLTKTFNNNITQELLDRGERAEWRPTLFSLCWLFSVIQERRKYGAMGWSIPYEFNQADLTAGIEFLHKNMYDNDLKKPVDWNTIRYMIGQVHFGGRVTDEYDRRLIETYCRQWLCQEVANPTPFKFSEGYTMPIQTKTMEGYFEYIRALSDTDSPEIFGLNVNADVVYRTTQSRDVLNIILSVQPKEGTGVGGETREVSVYKQCSSLLEKLPPDYVDSVVRQQIQRLGGMEGPAAPLNIFLQQEVMRMQAVLKLIRSDLNDLRSAIDGVIILSEHLMEVMNSLYDGKVPATWANISWQSTTLSFWMIALELRLGQYKHWLENDRPTRFRLDGFFNPQGFLTAVLQEYARLHELELDQVISMTTVMSKEKDLKRLGPGEGVYITDLTLEGAAWDKRQNGRLKDQTGKDHHAEMPPIQFGGRQGKRDEGDDAHYRCPVYRVPGRTDINFIIDIYLPTSVLPDYWTMRGVALLASTN